MMKKEEVEMAQKSRETFPSEETFRKIYENALENHPQAPEKVIKAYAAIGEALDAYINELSEHEFRYGYECGYQAAQKGGAE